MAIEVTTRRAADQTLRCGRGWRHSSVHVLNLCCLASLHGI